MLELEHEKFISLGFRFANLSAEPGLPPEICAECAREGVRHSCGLLAAFCDHSHVGAICIPPSSWLVVHPTDQTDFFAAVFRSPAMAAEKIRSGQPVQ